MHSCGPGRRLFNRPDTVMFKGIAKGIFNQRSKLPGNRATKKGLFPGLFYTTGNIKFIRGVFVFYTDFVGAVFFNLLKTGAVCYWDAGDGQNAQSNTLNITYTATGIKKVVCKIDNKKLITSLPNFSSAGITGTLDLSAFTGVSVGVTLLATSNPNLKKMLFPAVNVTVGSVGAAFCDLQNTVDISMINGDFGQIIFSGNPRLNQIILPKFGKACGYFYVSNSPLQGVLDTRGLVLSGYFNAGFCKFQSVFFTPSNGIFSIGFYLNGCDYLAGIIDLSMLTGLCVDIRLNNNALVTQYIFGASISLVTQIILSENTSLTALDLSPFTKLAGFITAQSCPVLTSAVFGVSTQIFSTINLQGCNITGALDVSGLSGLGGIFRCDNNTLLTGITFPASISGGANTMTWIAANSCNITGILDLSAITKLSGDLTLTLNPLLTTVILPTNALPMTSVSINSCSCTSVNWLSMSGLTSINGCNIQLGANAMSAAQVNTMLQDLDTISSSGFTGRIIVMTGTNAAPTGLGLVAKASLITKGFTVTTN